MSDWKSLPMFGGVDSGDVAVFVMMTLQVIVAPYTKVEESFNTQALHDIMHHGTNISAYDHLEFPGVVPRTFLGPLAVVVFLLPISLLQNFMYQTESRFAGQIKVRLALGILVLLALRRYKHVVSKVFGKNVGWWLMMITASQFHFTFYMSRPLPNIFALIIVLTAMQMWISRQHAAFTWLSVLAILIFRTELLLFLAPMMAIELYKMRVKRKWVGLLKNIAIHGSIASVCCLVISIAVDSYFWQRWLWPEGEVFFFNAILNKSSQYGTSPYLWYMYSVIPRCLLASLLLVPVAFRLETRSRLLVIPVVVFLLLFSILPHKELRFIIYVVPVLNTLAAITCSRWWQNREKSWVHTMLALLAVGHLFINLVLCGGFMYISHYNYPGGHTLAQLHTIEAKEQHVNVHLANLACQTGVTRFTQLHDEWVYNKTENLKAGGKELMSFTHLIMEVSGLDAPELKTYENTHQILAETWGYSRLKFNGLGELLVLNPVDIVLEPKLVLLKRVFE